MSEPKVSLIPEDKDLVIDWTPEWFVRLVRLLERNGITDEFLKIAEGGKHNVVVSVAFANATKKLLAHHGLHEKEKDAAAIILSAHCGCHGKTPV